MLMVMVMAMAMMMVMMLMLDADGGHGRGDGDDDGTDDVDDDDDHEDEDEDDDYDDDADGDGDRADQRYCNTITVAPANTITIAITVSSNQHHVLLQHPLSVVFIVLASPSLSQWSCRHAHPDPHLVSDGHVILLVIASPSSSPLLFPSSCSCLSSWSSLYFSSSSRRCHLSSPLQIWVCAAATYNLSCMLFS